MKRVEIMATINVLKFQTLVGYEKAEDKLPRLRSYCFFRSSLIRDCPVCYSDIHFVNYSSDQPAFYLRTEREKVFEILEHLLNMLTLSILISES